MKESLSNPTIVLRSSETSGAGYAEIDLRDRREKLKSSDLMFVVVDERSNPELVKEVWRLQRDIYIGKNIAPKTAWSVDGLTADVDRARGENVDYFVAINPETNEVVAAVRLIDGEYRNLPSYGRCGLEGTNGGEMLNMAANASNIVEIAALCKREDVSSEVIFSMYRTLFQNALNTDQSWFMGVVPSTRDELMTAFGPSVVKLLGEPVGLGMDGVDDSLTLTPLFIEPQKALFDMYQEAERSNPKRATYIKLLITYYSSGLDTNLVSRFVPEGILKRRRVRAPLAA